jgi:putative OmpL-like beta-barrel porin-2
MLSQRLAKVVLMGMMLASSPYLFSQGSGTGDTSADSPGSAVENKTWWRGITTDGFASLSYTYNTNDPSPRINQLRVFDFNDADPQLDVAQLVIQHPVGESGRFGFRFNMIAGSGVPEITAAYGLFRDTHTGIAHHFDIPEFYVSYLAPVGKGLRFDAGKFVTHFGYEVIGGYDGYNDNFSRGFIFGYGIPFTHTGVKVSYPFSNRISAAMLVTNGCDAVTRLNGAVTFGGQIAVTTSKTTSLTFNFLHGPEQPHNVNNERSVYELTGTWKALSRLALGADGLYADEDHAAANGSDAIWKGLAGYSKYSFTQQFSLAFRGEVFADIGGSRTGASQTLRGFTLTPEYVFPANLSRVRSELRHLDGNFVVRGEFRKDLSDREVFRRGTGFTDQQFTTAVNLIYLF